LKIAKKRRLITRVSFGGEQRAATPSPTGPITYAVYDVNLADYEQMPSMELEVRTFWVRPVLHKRRRRAEVCRR
jgi:hypothetical protein